MAYWIKVFNRADVGEYDQEILLEAIVQSNYYTLCDQYGLDKEGVEPALENLAVIQSPHEDAPFFVLKYQSEGKRPIVVYHWQVTDESGQEFVQFELDQVTSTAVREHLRLTRNIYGIALAKSQLFDMGLLLGYELARWLAERGSGLVVGLDGKWYQLNPYQAFVACELNE